MSVIAIAVFAAAVLSYVVFSEVLERVHITAPIVFVIVGVVLGGLLVHRPNPDIVRGLAELTLALLLFHDAAQVQPRDLRGDVGVCARLLLVALPLTIAAGFVVARVLFAGTSAWLALLLAAALAPTDAGLGAATVLNPVVPVRVRRILNVESGLNDGLATPIVLFALAASSGGMKHDLGTALSELAVGALVGVGVGVLAGYALSWARNAGFVQSGLLPVGTLAVPLLCYYGAVAVHGNGFVAAFVAGVAFAPSLGRRFVATTNQESLQVTAWVGTLLEYAVWCLFGVILVAHFGEFATWPGVLFALLSLTVVRMVPVAFVLLGTGFAQPTRWFIGWFGPRGLASVVFALIALEEYPDNGHVAQVIGTIALTVMLSVVLHGVTADVGAARYGAWVTRTHSSAELGAATAPIAGRGARRRGTVKE
ncbi:cation:proton antiporter domain-containing protein [Jatrophihabitans sp. DSM 45814]